MPNGPAERSAAKEYLKLNPKATNAEVMEAIDCSLRTVSYARSDLAAEGIERKGSGDRRPRRVNAQAAITAATSDTFDVATTADLNKAVGQELTKEAAREEREKKREAAANAAADAELGPDGDVDVNKLKRVLWRVVYRNTDDRVVVAAASAIARIQAEASERTKGAGKPLTRKDAVDRLVMMFEATGIKLVIEAIQQWIGLAVLVDAINDWIKHAQAQTADSGAAAQAPVQAAGTSDDGTRAPDGA